MMGIGFNIKLDNLDNHKTETSCGNVQCFYLYSKPSMAKSPGVSFKHQASMSLMATDKHSQSAESFSTLRNMARDV